jgi:hypothetical protein
MTLAFGMSSRPGAGLLEEPDRPRARVLGRSKALIIDKFRTPNATKRSRYYSGIAW